MKLIGYLNAAVAWREALEEYAPEAGSTQSDMIDVVQRAYSFQIFPQPAQLAQGGQPMVFSSGKFTGEPSFAIGTLVMEPDGDVVQTVTTDQAERFLEDLAVRLDNELGFRLSTTNKRKSYMSTLVVEFDGEFESRVQIISRMVDAIKPTFPYQGEFGLKRLSFGAPYLHAPASQVDLVEATDFVIERRAGTTFSQNRYYCTAPMTTADHLVVLGQIEAIALGN